MTDAGRDEVGRMVLHAWDAFLEQAAAVDLQRDTRLPGWRAQDVCVHLGVWPDHAALAGLAADARSGGTGSAGGPPAADPRGGGAPRPPPPAPAAPARRPTPTRSTRGSSPPIATPPGPRCWMRCGGPARPPSTTWPRS